VQLTKPDRAVACLPAYESEVTWLAENTGAHGYVLGRPKQVNNLLHRIAGPHDVRPELARLRSTYIVTLLAADVPFPVIAYATGITTGGRLGEYLQFVEPTTAARAAAALRGVRS
jgi:hypothetical protein